jgi:hypothetical protein
MKIQNSSLYGTFQTTTKSEDNTMEDFIKALREGKAYDWIATNGWKMEKDDLIRIIKEYDYAIYSSRETQLYDEVADELEDFL